MALTDIQVKKAKTKDKPYRLSDSGGMYLWLTPAGGKLWRWAYVYEGKEKLMSFGRYPDVSLAVARERLAEARRLLASGTDPMAQRKAERPRSAKRAKTPSRPSPRSGWSIGRRERVSATSIQRDVASTPIFCRAWVLGP
jgi:hypothetical protein